MTFRPNDWYNALKLWEKKGITRKIGFKASGRPGNFVKFSANEQIPIGSLLIFRDYGARVDRGDHVAIYAGYKNGYNWITHVGNKNGPEFCAVERMLFGPHPELPLAIFIPPTTVRFSAELNVNVTDEAGAPLSGVTVKLNPKNGQALNLGTTKDNGLLNKTNLKYGDYSLTFTVPEGYISETTTIALKLTTANNSLNTVTIKLAKKPIEVTPPPTEETETEQPADSAPLPQIDTKKEDE